MSVISGNATSLVRSCMRDRIRDVLVARILDGQYPAGTQLKELALAREFNVSQAPIREALRELEGSGLVTSERYRGTRVRGADLDEMRESYELRATLEARAIQLAMPCSADTINTLERCTRAMGEALERNDSEHYIEEALSFHRHLIEASGNRVFLTVWDSLHFDVRGRIALRRVAQLSGSLTHHVQSHARLAALLGAGDAAGAKRQLHEIFDEVTAAFQHSPQQQSLQQ